MDQELKVGVHLGTDTRSKNPLLSLFDSLSAVTGPRPLLLSSPPCSTSQRQALLMVNLGLSTMIRASESSSKLHPLPRRRQRRLQTYGTTQEIQVQSDDAKNLRGCYEASYQIFFRVRPSWSRDHAGSGSKRRFLPTSDPTQPTAAYPR